MLGYELDRRAVHHYLLKKLVEASYDFVYKWITTMVSLIGELHLMD